MNRHDGEPVDPEQPDPEHLGPDRSDPDRSEPGQPDGEDHGGVGPGAGQPAPSDEEIWLDLVARLEQTEEGDWDGIELAAEPLSLKPAPPEPPPPGTGPPRSERSLRDYFRPPGTEAPGTGPEADAHPGSADSGSPGGNGASTGPRDYSPEEDEEDFEPEDPPSLAGAEPLVVLAWLGVVGGPLALLLAAFFWRSAPLPAVLLVVAVFVASAVFLIMRLPQHRDDNDDGAIV